MFVVLLKFSRNREKVTDLMDGHKAWIKRGFEDGVFLMVGSLQPGLGGAVFAHNVTREALESRVGEDPFVAEDVVTAEILDIAPARADERLVFLLDS